jgi:hypothetical protein
MPSFDPQHLTPSASLNRVRIIDLPGLSVDSEVKGQTGFQLVSAAALARLIRQRAASLALDPDLDDHKLCLGLNDCLVSTKATTRASAEGIGRRIGRNMGYVLLTLRRGDAVNRAARDEWDDSYWHHWGRIEQVWLGGGLVSGRLGPVVREHASAVFGEAGVQDFIIQTSPYASILPLVGAARYAPPGCDVALVFDFGSTTIKRAQAIYRRDELVELRCLTSRPTGWTEIEGMSSDPVLQATRFFDHLVSVIIDTRRSVGLSPLSPILASVAAYVKDGHPMLTQGSAYYQLPLMADNLQAAMAQRLGTRPGDTANVLLIHDGTAAAATYAGAKHAAIVMMGTALGVGFPPRANRVRAMNAALAVLAPPADSTGSE